MRRLVVFILGVIVGAVIQRAGVVHDVLRLVKIRPFGRVVNFAQPLDSGVLVSTWRSRWSAAPVVLLVIGQSQAANFGERVHSSDSVWVFLDGRVHRSQEPMVGAEGNGGSVWPRLAHLLARGDEVTTLIIPAAIGGTELKKWEPSGAHGQFLRQKVAEAEKTGLAISAVLLMQGEADAAVGTPGESWRESFEAIAEALRQDGVRAPILLATETRCFAQPPDSAIRSAQQSVIGGGQALAGPDLDALGPEFRWDGCHLTAAGLDSAAVGWRFALHAAGVIKKPKEK